MRRLTRKKRGGVVNSREWVVENTEASINRFVNSNLPESGLGFQNMIGTMKNGEMNGGFWVVEWSLTRAADDSYGNFHLAWTNDDTEPEDLIRFVDGPNAVGGRKKRKRKTKKRKRKKRRKRKTKKKKRKRRKKRRKRTRRKRGGMDDGCANYKYKKYGNTEQKAQMRDRDDVTQAAADKYCKYMNKTTPKCYTPLGKCAKIDEAGIAIAPIFTDSDIQHLPGNLRRSLQSLQPHVRGTRGGGNLFARGNQTEQDGHRSIDELEPDGSQQIAERIVTQLMQLEGYDRQTAIDDVVNTAESNDPDDVAQWSRWIARANRIVDPFVEDQHGEEEAQRGAQKRAEREILVAQKEDGAVPSLRERAIGASKEGSSKEDEQLVMDRLNNQ